MVTTSIDSYCSSFIILYFIIIISSRDIIFTYNLYQFIGEILEKEKFDGRLDGFSITVKRNDEVSLEELRAAKPDRLIISPGPGSPSGWLPCVPL